MSTRNLLVELLVEELPPKSLKVLGEVFGREVRQGLISKSFTKSEPAWNWFATPRRLAVCVHDVKSESPPKNIQIKLMPVSVALDKAGKPTAALLKKMSSHGLDATVLPELRRVVDGKNEILVWEGLDAGFLLASELIDILNVAVAKLPIPKMMAYQLEKGDMHDFQPGWTTVRFVRPAHGLVVLHGDEVLAVPGFVLGLLGGKVTRGHRFQVSDTPIELRNADSYAAQMWQAAVVVSFAERRSRIVEELSNAAERIGLRSIHDDDLLDEVTSLVEWPTVFTCEFETEFLEVPQECLILTMKANQKYFPLLDADGKLSNKFLIVSNIRPADPSRIIEGNERVVRPRLADAKFFYEQDRKETLESRRERLREVVYHNKLGSVWERSERVSILARRQISESISGEPYLNSRLSYKTKRASELAKADLVTNMVGEFPELQGIMGRYYALADGEDAEVAEAIREHYLPRGAGDKLPATQTGMALALADKIDTIAGVFAIDQKPTGAKDPFGVRRAAIGIVRILVEGRVNLDLREVILNAVQLQPDQNPPGAAVQAPPVPLGVTPWYVERAEGIYDYIMERLRGYYLEGTGQFVITTEMFDAVLANRPTSPFDFDRRLQALSEFLKLSDAESLAAANKRITNILRKAGQSSLTKVDVELLNDPAEQELHDQLVAMKNATDPLFVARDYGSTLSTLANLRPAVDAFFDGVMVMAEDSAIRGNRLALLAQLRDLFLRVADLSRLPG